VAQVIADLLERKTLGEQVRRARVSQSVRVVPMERLAQAQLANLLDRLVGDQRARRGSGYSVSPRGTAPVRQVIPL
jgi:hypothetical protein